MFCVHLLPNICFCGEFLPLADINFKKKKKPTCNSNKRIFWGKNVPILPDFDEKKSEIITFRQ
jgi:hypothetical protein